MIEKVIGKNIRGLDFEVSLGEKTLCVGPNGSGKTSIAAAINIAHLGYIPGSKVSETILNASGNPMRCRVDHDGGKNVAREFEQGKTLQERVSVNGQPWQKRNAADGMITLAFGTAPQVVDMPAFHAAPAAEKRRQLLRLTPDVGADVVEQLMADEKKARDTLNAKRAMRQAAEKHLAGLTAELGEIEFPAGDFARLQAERLEAVEHEKEYAHKVAEANANDRARVNLQDLVASLPSLQAERDELEAQLKEANTSVADIEQKQAAHALTAPVMPAGGERAQAFEAVEQSLLLLLDLITDDAENIIIESALQEIIACGPDRADMQKYNQAFSTYQTIENELQRRLEDQSALALRVERKMDNIASRLTTAQAAQNKLASIGPTLTANDEAALAGARARVDELDAKLEPLRERKVRHEQSERARLEVAAAGKAEDQAKADLEDASTAQLVVLREVTDKLAIRSKVVLPFGNLRLEDAGSQGLTIYWAKDAETKVPRETLSGGEKAMFDCAVGYAIAPQAIIVIEGAEMDDQWLLTTMEKLTALPAQVLLMTCHGPTGSIPDGWTTVDMEVKADA